MLFIASLTSSFSYFKWVSCVSCSVLLPAFCGFSLPCFLFVDQSSSVQSPPAPGLSTCFQLSQSLCCSSQSSPHPSSGPSSWFGDVCRNLFVFVINCISPSLFFPLNLPGAAESVSRGALLTSTHTPVWFDRSSVPNGKKITEVGAVGGRFICMPPLYVLIFLLHRGADKSPSPPH